MNPLGICPVCGEFSEDWSFLTKCTKCASVWCNVTTPTDENVEGYKWTKDILVNGIKPTDVPPPTDYEHDPRD